MPSPRRITHPRNAHGRTGASARRTAFLVKNCHCEASAHTGCGERTERCRWQRKRSERVAAVKILSVRRKAAQNFWAPQQGHRPLRKRILRCVGEGLCPQPAVRWQNFLPRFICIPAYTFRHSHQHRLGSIRKNLCVYLIFPEVTIFSSCRENLFVLCSV